MDIYFGEKFSDNMPQLLRNDHEGNYGKEGQRLQRMGDGVSRLLSTGKCIRTEGLLSPHRLFPSCFSGLAGCVRAFFPIFPCWLFSHSFPHDLPAISPHHPVDESWAEKARGEENSSEEQRRV